MMRSRSVRVSWRALVAVLATLWGVTEVEGKKVVLPGLGTLDGTTTLSSWSNRTIFQYRGIPYVEPPIGNLRFKRPVAYSGGWSGTFNATDYGPVCPQQDQGVPPERGRQDEDCLHINVYTTTTEGGGVGKGLPVMVYIHGGSFRVGSALNILPHFLLEEDVILVVPQYRLGVFGFLSMKTEEVPGNQGLLDMIEALRWVKKYIEHFGGDPTRVTLFGQSAGGGAVSLMLFSPLVEDGLIERIIVQGGSALGSWVVDPDPVTHAQEFSAVANCTQTTLADLASCLRGRTTKQILDAYSTYRKLGKFGGNRAVFNEAGNKSFLLDDPQVLFKQGKFKHIPIMGGVTQNEGSFCAADIYDQVLAMNLTNSKEFLTRDLTKITLAYSGIKDPTGYLSDTTRDQYFQESDFNTITSMVPGIMDISGSALIKACTFTMVNEMSRHVPSYLYSFHFAGRFTSYGYFSTYGPGPGYWTYPFSAGVAHADELLYIFPQDYAIFNEEETKMAQKMVQFWASFATYGIPNATGAPLWPKVSTAKGPYMKINALSTVRSNFIDEYYTAVQTARSSGVVFRTSVLTLVMMLVVYL